VDFQVILLPSEVTTKKRSDSEVWFVL